jgi:hypothetical protein
MALDTSETRICQESFAEACAARFIPIERGVEVHFGPRLRRISERIELR